MKRLTLILLVIFGMSQFSLSLPAAESGDGKAVAQDAQEEKPVGGESGKKGGIYVVGRGFKTAGSEMEKGFKAAGRGIVKGGKATGRGFKKAGGAIKNFFTGETGEKK